MDLQGGSFLVAITAFQDLHKGDMALMDCVSFAIGRACGDRFRDCRP